MTYQMFCSKCFRKFEAPTLELAYARVMDHELRCKEVPRPEEDVKPLSNS